MCETLRCVGRLASVTERMVAWAALTLVVMCIFLTTVIAMGLGIGLGYNYCFVEQKTPKDLGKSLRNAERFIEIAREMRTPSPSLVPATTTTKPTKAIPTTTIFTTKKTSTVTHTTTRFKINATSQSTPTS